MGLALSNPTHGNPNLARATANRRRIQPFSDLPADRISPGAVPKKFKNRVLDESPPPDLPAEILGELLDRLSPADRIRFSAVCKSWWKVVREHKNRASDALPWLVSYKMKIKSTSEPIICVCKLFDAMHQRAYSVDEICSEDKFSKCQTAVRGLNHGWLVFSWESRTDVTSFLLFSPFTREIISLPELNYILDENVRILSSHSPSSPGNDFYILDCDLTRIRTCKSGDMEWKTTQFGIDNMVHGAVWYGGFLYCVDDRGYVRAFDVIRKSQRSFVHQAPITRRLENSRFDLVLCKGKLLLVQCKQAHGSDKQNLFHVFELTPTKWVERKRLGDQALVFYSPSFSVSTSGSSTRNMASRIYFKSYNRVSKCNEMKYFSLEDGKCHRCEESVYSSSLLAEGLWVQPPKFRI